jgi:hypothetical protein
MSGERWTARTVDDPRGVADGNAPAATSADTGTRQPASDDTTMPSSATTLDIPTSTDSGDSGGRRASGSAPPNSRSSAPPSTGSSRRWRAPDNARQFAAQANRVATMVLNGEMDVDTARLYSAVARTVAQALSTEVSRSRFLAQAPDLTLEDEDVFEPNVATAWDEERRRIVPGGHRFVGATDAERDCDHGRSAHTAIGCADCACRMTYDGGLAQREPS